VIARSVAILLWRKVLGVEVVEMYMTVTSLVVFGVLPLWYY
jgi:hypothetical protein